MTGLLYTCHRIFYGSSKKQIKGEWAKMYERWSIYQTLTPSVEMGS